MRTRTLVVLLGILLVGCATPEPFDLEPERGPSVRESRYGFVVRFPTDRAEPEPAERARLEAFLAGLPAEGRYEAIVFGHADERGSDAYNLALSRRRARYVAEILRRRGIDRVELATAAFGERRPLDPGRDETAWARNRRVEVEIRHWVVDAPACAGRDRAPALHGQRLVPELGCATLANLVEMVADPADLAEGRALGPADGVREAEAVQRYRTDKVKPLIVERGGP
ncbi:MAG: CpaD family pilus assembly lipoprotein [Geminicoccaceae bacterium]|nr:CpaD family pilus assembly lipoprotein [Geminicoccaceae bacterium]